MAGMCLVLLLVGNMAHSQSEAAIRLEPHEPVARVAQPYLVDCVVYWAGPPGACAVLPVAAAESDSPGWRAVQVLSTTAAAEKDMKEMPWFVDSSLPESETERHFVIQTLSAEPLEAGELAFPEISVKVVPSGDAALKPGLLDADGAISLRPEPLQVTVRASARPWVYWAGAAAGAFVLACALAGWWLMRRRRLLAQAGGQDSAVASAQMLFHEARRHRLDGRYYECYRVLAQLAVRLGNAPDAAVLAEKMQARAQDAGYRGVRPSEDQLEGDFRDVERLIRHREEEERS